jgi:uncharacterized membrane protein YedE/YeeE
VNAAATPMNIGATDCGLRCRVMSIVLATVAGGLFGAGLLISGMTEPAKVVGFLNLLGDWDPSLLFVMGGASVTYAIAFRVIQARRRDPWFDAKFHVPTRRDLDPQLIAGAALFGIGWGLGGYCPGPGLVSAASGSTAALAFVGAMLAGMYAQHRTAR